MKTRYNQEVAIPGHSGIIGTMEKRNEKRIPMKFEICKTSRNVPETARFAVESEWDEIEKETRYFFEVDSLQDVLTFLAEQGERAVLDVPEAGWSEFPKITLVDTWIEEA
jgi:hypothetical protein